MTKRPTRAQGQGGSGQAGGGYENPQPDGGETGSEYEGSESYKAPSTDALAAEAAESEAYAAEAEISSDLVALKHELDDMLSGAAGVAAAAAGAQELDDQNIVGVGYGSGDGFALSGPLSANVLPGQQALVVFTVEAVPTEQVIGEMASAAGTHALSTVPIIQVPVGLVEAQPNVKRIRPAPGGISSGHFKITAGTLGCLATGLSAPNNSRLLALSNNHVFANSNAASLGDCICQPGPYDGGKCPQDQIAILNSFVPINFSGGINYVDAATGWCWPDRVRKELMYMSGTTPVYFRVGSVPVAPVVGMTVGKTGRTTQLKQGRITAINVTVNVNYGGGKVAHFRDQIAIVGNGAQFSAGGDSGSLIWQWAGALPPVGLLFAGGGGTTFGNRITRVLQALNIKLIT